MAFSEAGICNIALSYLGEYEVNNIITPTTPTERTCNLHYDLSRRSAIRESLPNFALTREYFNEDSETPAFGWSYQYVMPNDCLRVLGIGEDITDKDYSYSIEGRKVLVPDEFSEGLPVRFVADVTDLTLYDDTFVRYFAMRLAADMCLDITNDYNKMQIIDKKRVEFLNSYQAINGQENRPVKFNRSRYKESRFAGNYPYRRYKR